jgi:peptide/nickel transport system permease protein
MLIGRLAWSVVILAGTSAITFVLAYLVPADPARTLAGPKADPATLTRIRSEMGLDQPLATQYARYLRRLLRGDLGRSYATRQPVRQAILDRLPATALLAGAALAIAALLGVGLGVTTAAFAGRWVDMAVLVAALAVVSFPTFWLGLLLLSVFAAWLQLLPLGGSGSVKHLALPALTLGLGLGAYYARLVHANLAEAVGADFVRTARAKGVPAWRVYGVHALRHALLPLLSVIGLDLAGLLSGVVLTESVFNWPGLGRLAVEAVFNQDIPMILGTVLFSAAVVVSANFAADALYRVVDPRIRRPVTGEGRG